MSFKTLSAILRGGWLMDKQWANAHLPVVAGLMKGEQIDFGTEKKDDHVNLHSICAHMGAGSPKIYGVRPYSNLNNIENGSIAMVTLSGPMIKNGDECSYGMIDQAQLITMLAGANNIAGIILNIDSPGGQADGTAMLAGAIKDAGAIKPVVAVIDDGMAASAAMWIASAANEIYVTQATDQVGSIGVYTTIADWASYYESQGLKITEIYAPQSTEKNKGYYDALGGDDTLIKQDLSVMADQFINTVSVNRAGKIKGDSWKTGKMFFAADAKKIGLIDGIKSMGQVVARMGNLIKQQQSNSNIMAFEKTLVAAKATQFAVTDEGFLLSEANLNNLEAALATIEAAEQTRIELTAAKAANNQLNLTLSDMETERNTAQGSITVNAARIAELQAEVAALGGQSSGKGTVITTKEDNATGEAEAVPSWLDENSPINQFADKRVKTKKK